MYKLTTMVVSLGNWNPTENCWLTTFHSSFMVHWWGCCQVHRGPRDLHTTQLLLTNIPDLDPEIQSKIVKS